MNVPDLQALRRGEPAAWDEAFAWLWPVVFGAAQAKLQAVLPDSVEDAAMEALEELVEKVRDVKSAGELRPLAASIAHHRAVDRLRQHFAAKRGGGQTESLDAHEEETGNPAGHAPGGSPLDALTQKERTEFFCRLLAELKPPQGELLADFYLRGLGYEEMARKHKMAVGSVGVYLKRGLEAVRRAWGREC